VPPVHALATAGQPCAVSATRTRTASDWSRSNLPTKDHPTSSSTADKVSFDCDGAGSGDRHRNDPGSDRGQAWCARLGHPRRDL